MKKYLSIILLATGLHASAQYTTRNAHAHNDYAHAIPFYTAYYPGFGSIEADVFERDGRLLVAHNTSDIDSARSLERLYLQPLQDMISKNGGTAYPNSKDTLQLLIDFKTPGIITIKALLQLLAQYPVISNNATVRIVISGNQPSPVLWGQYPGYIYFDGKYGGQYTPAQAQRIPLFSADIKTFTKWNGKGDIVQTEKTRIRQWIDSVHQAGKKIRFWGVTDNTNTWKTQENMGADYIGTDKIEALTDFLRSSSTTSP